MKPRAPPLHTAQFRFPTGPNTVFTFDGPAKEGPYELARTPRRLAGRVGWMARNPGRPGIVDPQTLVRGGGILGPGPSVEPAPQNPAPEGMELTQKPRNPLNPAPVAHRTTPPRHARRRQVGCRERNLTKPGLTSLLAGRAEGP